MSNGIRQGGVLSPFLFLVYVDDLLVQINKSGYGYEIGKGNVGAVSVY